MQRTASRARWAQATALLDNGGDILVAAPLSQVVDRIGAKAQAGR